MSIAIRVADRVAGDVKAAKPRKRRGKKSKTSRNSERGNHGVQVQRAGAHGEATGKPISDIMIYMEGGGDGANSRAALRQGMVKFLTPLRDAANEKGADLLVVPCGARSETFKRFRKAIDDKDGRLIMLLVDSEAEVKGSASAHLQVNDRWDLKGISDDTIHLMAQAMETWIVADPDALDRYYGRGFQKDALPAASDLETVAKKDVDDGLKKASRNTRKGEYHKTRHAPSLLGEISPATVQERCRRQCARMFDALLKLIQGA